jgi:hypothetical protein
MSRQERAVDAVGLVGDHAEIGGGVGLPRANPGAFQLHAQGGRQRGAGDERLFQ